VTEREGDREREKDNVTKEEGEEEKNRAILSDNGDDGEQGRDALHLQTV
jgi:hypothetical protein